MKKPIAFIVTLVFSAVFLCGCLSPVSLDAYGYVISIGVDRGREKRFYVTFALQRELEQSNTETEGGADILTCECDCLDEAKTEVEGRVPFTLSFSRTNFFIFSSEVAESGAIEEFLSFSFDAEKIRTSAALVVTKNSVYEFIGALSANNDANITKLQTAVMHDMEKTGMVAIMSVSMLFEAAETGLFDYTAPLGSTNEDIITDMEQKKAQAEGKNPLKDVKPGDIVGGLKSQMCGTALFSGWRKTGELTRDDTMYLNMANGEFINGAISLPCGEDGSPATVLLSMNGVKRRLVPGEKPRAAVSISLKASLHKSPPNAEKSLINEWIVNSIPGYIENRLYEVFSKCRAAHSDAMRFGASAAMQMRSAYEMLSFDRAAFLDSLEAEFTVEISNTDVTVSEERR